MTNEARTAAILQDGCLLSHTVRGEGPPVLLIQGAGIHGSAWEPQVDFLARQFRCLTFDNRGIGVSQPPSSGRLAPPTIPQMAADALALLDSQGWQSAHVAGHSMGGLIALEMALQAKERVRSLALLCTFARGSIATTLTPAMLWTGLRTRLGTRAMRRRAFLEMVMPPGVPADPIRIGELFGHDLADQPAITMKQLAAIRKHDVTARLPELAGVPTLVLSASGDRIAPPFAGRAIAEGIPGARYVEMTGAAHGITVQKPAEVNALLADHFAAAESRRAAAAS